MDDRKHSYRHYRLDCTARLLTLGDQIVPIGSRAFDVLIALR
jgi:hypothetical protein